MLCNLGEAGAFFRRGEEKQTEKKKVKAQSKYIGLQLVLM